VSFLRTVASRLCFWFTPCDLSEVEVFYHVRLLSAGECEYQNRSHQKSVPVPIQTSRRSPQRHSVSERFWIMAQCFRGASAAKK
jgi:hypothetical protein